MKKYRDEFPLLGERAKVRGIAQDPLILTFSLWRRNFMYFLKISFKNVLRLCTVL